MRKKAFSIIVLGLTLGVAAATTAEDCPDCPTSVMTSPLDPNWKDFSPPPLAPGESPDCHRVQFGKKKCEDCHITDTPVAYKQWLGSKHGINSVKCGICHGDAVNYRRAPDRAVCIGCHSQQVNNLPADSLITNCSYCHKAHWFTIHNIEKYEAFSADREMRFEVPGF